MIYLQSQVFDHRECSVSLGWGSTQRNAVIRRYSALVDGALLSGYALIAQKWLNTAITRCKQLQTIALVLVCRCGMWGRPALGEVDFGGSPVEWVHPLEIRRHLTLKLGR